MYAMSFNSAVIKLLQGSATKQTMLGELKSHCCKVPALFSCQRCVNEFCTLHTFKIHGINTCCGQTTQLSICPSKSRQREPSRYYLLSSKTNLLHCCTTNTNPTLVKYLTTVNQLTMKAISCRNNKNQQHQLTTDRWHKYWYGTTSTRVT